MKPPRNLVGPTISRLRNGKGLSQPQFAAIFQRQGWDMSREVLAQIETGRRRLTDFEVVFIARCLKIPVTDLFPKIGLTQQVDDLIQRAERSME